MLIIYKILSFNSESYSSYPSILGVRLDPVKYLLVIFVRDSVITRLLL